MRLFKLQFKVTTKQGIIVVDKNISIEQAIKVVSLVYDINADKIFRKQIKSLQFWLLRASNSQKLTVSKAMMIESIVNKKRKWYQKIFK